MEKQNLLLLIFLIFFNISVSASPNSPYESLLKCFVDTKIPSSEASRIIYSPTNPSFSSVLGSYIRNRRFNVSTTLKPSAIITPTADRHVSAAVSCSKKLGILLKIRSGGHDYEGLSYTSTRPFVVVDMFNLRSVDIDLNDRTAWVESGAILGELYYKIWEKSNRLAFPGGVCPTLGVGGHITGGGYGNLMRKYGLTVDNVLDARIVDAGGRILDRKSMGEDLFWAIRGGGAASFGVILAYKVKLVPVLEKVTVFRVEKGDDEDGVDALFRFQEVGERIDDDLFIRALLQPAQSVAGNQTLNGARVVFMGMFLGNPEKLLTLTGSEFPNLGLKRSGCVEMPWINSVLFWVNLDNTTSPNVLLNRNPKQPDFFRRKSDYVKEPIPKLGLKSLLKKVGGGNVGLLFNPYGGVMSRIAENATACPHRSGNLYKIHDWEEEGEVAERKYTRQIREMFDFMAPFVSKNPREAFLNYRDLDIGVTKSLNGSYEEGKVYGVKYFKDNFDRLVKIKTRVDPDNFFRNEQSIPVGHYTGKEA